MWTVNDMPVASSYKQEFRQNGEKQSFFRIFFLILNFFHIFLFVFGCCFAVLSVKLLFRPFFSTFVQSVNVPKMYFSMVMFKYLMSFWELIVYNITIYAMWIYYWNGFSSFRHFCFYSTFCSFCPVLVWLIDTHRI